MWFHHISLWPRSEPVPCVPRTHSGLFRLAAAMVCLLSCGPTGCGALGSGNHRSGSIQSNVGNGARSRTRRGDPTGLESWSTFEIASSANTASWRARGHNIGALTDDECLQLLESQGVSVVPFREPPAAAVDTPVSLTGPIHGVEYQHVGRSAVHSVLDCRLVVALGIWSARLHAAGIEYVGHLSMLRPGARVSSTGKTSGHARGTAIDVRYLRFVDGTELDVFRHWTERTRGAPPCANYDETPESSLLRNLVCDAIDQDLFQTVITPHHDNRHQNHVHLELVPGVDWKYIR